MLLVRGWWIFIFVISFLVFSSTLFFLGDDAQAKSLDTSPEGALGGGGHKGGDGGGSDGSHKGGGDNSPLRGALDEGGHKGGADNSPEKEPVNAVGSGAQRSGEALKDVSGGGADRHAGKAVKPVSEVGGLASSKEIAEPSRIIEPVADRGAEGIAQPLLKEANPLSTSPTLEPVNNVAEPALRTAGQAVEPITTTSSSITEPVAEMASPVIEPVKEVTDPVVEPAVGDAVGTVSKALDPVVAPVLDSLGEAVDPILTPVEGSLEDFTEPLGGSMSPLASPFDESATSLAASLDTGVLGTGVGTPAAIDSVLSVPPLADPSLEQPVEEPVESATAVRPVGEVADAVLLVSAEPFDAISSEGAALWSVLASVGQEESSVEVSSDAFASRLAATEQQQEAPVVSRTLIGEFPVALQGAAAVSWLRDVLPTQVPQPLSAAGTGSGSLSSGTNSNGGAASAVLALMLISLLLGGKLLLYAGEFLKPSTALIPIIERPG